jgi:membrane protein required for colicin V production
MNWADWSIIAVIAISCIIGLMRGFIKEALSLVVWIAAFIIAITFRDSMAQILIDFIEIPSVREMAAFAILFAATLIVGAMVNYLIGELVKMTGLTGTDRLFGMLFGVARGIAVVLAVVILVPPVLSIDQDPWWLNSVLIPHFQAMEGWSRQVVELLTQFIINLF